MSERFIKVTLNAEGRYSAEAEWLKNKSVMPPRVHSACSKEIAIKELISFLKKDEYFKQFLHDKDEFVIEEYFEYSHDASNKEAKFYSGVELKLDTDSVAVYGNWVEGYFCSECGRCSDSYVRMPGYCEVCINCGETIDGGNVIKATARLIPDPDQGWFSRNFFKTKYITEVK